VGSTFVLRPREIAAFKACRRAWDFEARVRQNLVPVRPASVFDFDKAVHVALAVYYFPAMDDWNRSIVRPLALQGFGRAMADDRAAYEEVAPLTPEQEDQWTRSLRLGNVVLGRFFDWAGPNDDFESILADEDLWVPVPDPDDPARDIGTADGREIRYFGRVDQVISDQHDEYWVVDHRIAWGEWASDEELLGDDDATRAQWALEVAYPQVKAAGTVYNELLVRGDELDRDEHRTAADLDTAADLRDMTRGVRHLNTRRGPSTPSGHLPPLVAPFAADDPIGGRGLGDPDLRDRDRVVARIGNEVVRRTFVSRTRQTMVRVHRTMAEDALALRDPEVEVFPSPAEERCSVCPYAKPCSMLDAGLDISATVEREYRVRRPEEFEEEGLRWSPRRRAQRASLGGAAARNETVNFRWG
jgi:hypothetical protein